MPLPWLYYLTRAVNPAQISPQRILATRRSPRKLKKAGAPSIRIVVVRGSKRELCTRNICTEKLGMNFVQTCKVEQLNFAQIRENDIGGVQCSYANRY